MERSLASNWNRKAEGMIEYSTETSGGNENVIYKLIKDTCNYKIYQTHRMYNTKREP